MQNQQLWDEDFSSFVSSDFLGTEIPFFLCWFFFFWMDLI